MKSTELEMKMAPALEALGLFCFGWFVMPDEPFMGRKAVLIGNRAEDGEHKMWRVFRQSPEYADGKANALDRWTERLVGAVAADMGAVAVFPFGEKVWPFQRYAKAATHMRSSPLGLLIHPEHGLWQAFRAVIIFDQKITLDTGLNRKLADGGYSHPCETCKARPCLSACPVDAFGQDGFAVSKCRDHLATGTEPRCMETGCRARAACPVGVPYSDAQIRFHMKAFGRV